MSIADNMRKITNEVIQENMKTRFQSMITEVREQAEIGLDCITFQDMPEPIKSMFKQNGFHVVDDERTSKTEIKW